MAKQTGIPTTISVDDSAGTARAIGPDIRNFTLNNTISLLDVTGLDKAAMERLSGLQDAEVALNGVFNAASGMSHDVLKDFQTNEREVVIDYGTPTLTFTVRFENYNVSRADDGGLTWSATGRLSNGSVPVWA